ncbi:hypothetical protein AB1Y20_016180 [Prymnesium parvum]|uniref:Glycosyltransferase family 92 protein n=1 Tax=Prymnesium parvum TaxID=97485 RepID=A0AB34ID80_PRYPA
MGVSSSRVHANDSKWSDHLMLDRVNRLLKTLPKTAWFIFANIDEFFEYPSDLLSMIQKGYQVFCACMEDWVAGNGKVTTLKPGINISHQYPTSCGSVRKHISSVSITTSKVVLLKVAGGEKSSARQFKTPHRLYWMYGKRGRCYMVPPFRHYTMTTQYADGIRHKLRNYNWTDTTRSTYVLQLTLLEAYFEDSEKPIISPPTEWTFASSIPHSKAREIMKAYAKIRRHYNLTLATAANLLKEPWCNPLQYGLGTCTAAVVHNSSVKPFV